ncbi:MAG: hypothetical protein K2X29_04610, partial [Candidatus Obscuribacterales bacterium]|nr:hypothetical protein [Candidatus Obscuribacterales bacterium]
TDLAGQLAKEISGSAPANTVSAPQAAKPQPAQASQTAPADPALAQVAMLEGQRNYKAAIQLLNNLVTNNMNNADLHHRLAMNLKADGLLGEALSEFRIAAAFAPANADYAKDLSAAVAANKANLLSEMKKPAIDHNGGQ